MNNEEIKREILTLLEEREVLWISEMHRKLISVDSKISWARVSKLLQELEDEGQIEHEIYGRLKTYRIKRV